MKTFSDNAGRTWQFALTIDSAKRVKHLLNVNLLELQEGDPPLLTRLGTDVILLCDIIYALIKPQADQLQVTDQQFGAALGGDVILAAQKAVYEELINFFQSLARTDMARAIQAQQRLIEAAIRHVESGVADAEAKALGDLSTKSPASSA